MSGVSLVPDVADLATALHHAVTNSTWRAMVGAAAHSSLQHSHPWAAVAAALAGRMKATARNAARIDCGPVPCPVEGGAEVEQTARVLWALQVGAVAVAGAADGVEGEPARPCPLLLQEASSSSAPQGQRGAACNGLQWVVSGPFCVVAAVEPRVRVVVSVGGPAARACSTSL
jgi:hypothetical protein